MKANKDRWPRYFPAAAAKRQIYGLSLSLGPTREEMINCLNDLRRLLGWRRQWLLCALLGVPWDTVRTWYVNGVGRRNGTPTSRRMIWLTWALLCRPGQISTVWHMMTCGRMTDSASPARAGVQRRREQAEAEDGPGPDEFVDEVLKAAIASLNQQDETVWSAVEQKRAERARIKRRLKRAEARKAREALQRNPLHGGKARNPW